MLGQEKQKKSSRWVRLSLAAGILLVVVVCAAAFSSSSPTSLGQKNMVAGVDSEPYDGDLDMASTVPQADEPTPEMDDLEVENVENVDEDGDMAVENESSDHPKKVRLCDKLCGHYFRGKKKRACKKDCKDDQGDSSKPRACVRDCKKACRDLAPPGKIGNCFVKCDKRFCPRRVKFCLKMCKVLGKRQFKNPVRKNIRQCQKDCPKEIRIRNNPRKCHKKCMKMCKKWAKKLAVCKGDCKMMCPSI